MPFLIPDPWVPSKAVWLPAHPYLLCFYSHSLFLPL